MGGSRRGEDIDWNSERIKGATEQTEELIQQIVELSYECVVCVYSFVYILVFVYVVCVCVCRFVVRL